MGRYVNDSLSNKERVVYEGKITLLSLIPHILLMFFGIGFLTIWKPIIRYATTELAITNRKVAGKLGLIKTKEMNSPLKAVQNVSVANGFFGKLFNYGTISITTASGEYLFKNIKDANQFKNRLMSQIEKYKEDEMDRNAKKIAMAMNANTERIATAMNNTPDKNPTE